MNRILICILISIILASCVTDREATQVTDRVLTFKRSETHYRMISGQWVAQTWYFYEDDHGEEFYRLIYEGQKFTLHERSKN